MFAFDLIVLNTSKSNNFSFDKNLLRSRFSFAEYVARFVLNLTHEPPTKPQAPARTLFPKLEDAEIVNLNNTIRGTARVCAADDLELSLSGGYDEIDFLDTNSPLNPRLDQFDERLHYNNHGYVSVLHTPQWDEQAKNKALSYGPAGVASSQMLSPSTSLPLESAHSSLHSSASKTQAPFVQIQSQPLPQSYFQHDDYANQSHFALNMIGLNTHFAFNDFGYSTTHADSLSIDYSSSESNASPLDEMFLKDSVDLKVSKGLPAPLVSQKSLKRKFDDFSPSSSISETQNSDLFPMGTNHHEIASLYGFPKKMKVEGLNMSMGHEIENGESALSEEDLKYKCDQCDSKFKVKSYLTRHKRKHFNANAFVCPFFESEAPQEVKQGTRCHHSGGFSRRDTYKTHLKALHFIYPPGTKSSDRNSIGGRCAGCFDFFESNVKWLKFHIEGNQCKSIVGKGASVEIKQEDIKLELEQL